MNKSLLKASNHTRHKAHNDTTLIIHSSGVHASNYKGKPKVHNMPLGVGDGNARKWPKMPKILLGITTATLLDIKWVRFFL